MLFGHRSEDQSSPCAYGDSFHCVAMLVMPDDTSGDTASHSARYGVVGPARGGVSRGVITAVGTWGSVIALLAFVMDDRPQ